jgi:hypothetical protein
MRPCPHSHEAMSQFSREECPSTTGAAADSKMTLEDVPSCVERQWRPVIISPASTHCVLHSALTATPKILTDHDELTRTSQLASPADAAVHPRCPLGPQACRGRPHLTLNGLDWSPVE